MARNPMKNARSVGLSLSILMSTTSLGAANDVLHTNSAFSISGFVSNSSISDAISTGRSDNGVASRNRTPFTFSAANLGSDAGINVWTGGHAFEAFGNATGGGYKTHFGAGYEFGQSEIGLFYARSDELLFFGTTSASTENNSFGAYASTGFAGNWKATGHLSFGETEIFVPGGNGKGNRTAGEITVSNSYNLGMIEMNPYLAAGAMSQELPAMTISGTAAPARTLFAMSGAIGSTMYYQTDTNTRPFLMVAAEATSFDDGIGNSDSHIAPRLGFGVESDGEFLDFKLLVETGEYVDGVRDRAIGLNFNLDF